MLSAELPNLAPVPLYKTGSTGPARETTWTGLGLDGLAAGRRCRLAAVPVAGSSYGFVGQLFVLSNTNPAVLGAGTPRDSVGINPGNAFGLGSSIPVDTDDAYRLATVPEPSTGAALLALLVLLRRRPRRAG